MIKEYNNTIICVNNSDMTGTNDYTEIVIIAKSEKECDEILDVQLTDGIFENSRTGKVITIRTESVRIEILDNGAIKMR